MNMKNSVLLNFRTEPAKDVNEVDGNLSIDFTIFGEIPVIQKCYFRITHL